MSTDVLVVGAGPTGLTLACELALAGDALSAELPATLQVGQMALLRLRSGLSIARPVTCSCMFPVMATARACACAPADRPPG